MAIKHRCLAFSGVLEGLGRSGRLVGSISTYPGTSKCPGSRVVAKNPPRGIFFTEYGIVISVNTQDPQNALINSISVQGSTVVEK